MRLLQKTSKKMKVYVEESQSGVEYWLEDDLGARQRIDFPYADLEILSIIRQHIHERKESGA